MLILLFLYNVNIQISVFNISLLINLLIYIYLYVLYSGPIYLAFILKFDIIYCFLLLYIITTLFVKK